MRRRIAIITLGCVFLAGCQSAHSTPAPKRVTVTMTTTATRTVTVSVTPSVAVSTSTVTRTQEQDYLYNQYSKSFYISINVNDYVEHRAEVLQSYAQKLAQRALEDRRGQHTDPMFNSERKIIHRIISRIDVAIIAYPGIYACPKLC